MAIFNMVGCGGSSLNYEVVKGTSAPSNPKENTIWVNTDAEISEYIFAYKDPGGGNLLDFTTWAKTVAVSNGTKTVDGSSITLTANGITCYTSYSDEISRIPCEAGKTYVIQWDYSGDSNTSMQLYPNGNSGNGVWAYGNTGKLEYTVPDGVTFFNFTIVVSPNKTSTFSNIRIAEKGVSVHDIAEGTVWISTGAVSPVGFNALKNNGIMIYPLAAKQYLNGAWVDKVAKIRQSNAWVDLWNGALYTSGNEWSAVTGGWYGKPWKVTNSSGVVAAETINIDRGASYIRMSFDSSREQRSGVLLTTKKIDLSKYNTLTFNGFISQNGYTNTYKANGVVCVFANIGDDYYDKKYVASAEIANNGTATTITIDISGLPDGEYFIGVSLYNYKATAAFVQMNSLVLT